MEKIISYPASPRVLRVRIVYAVYLIVARVINAVLSLFSLRKKSQFWGIVYDSVSKQPLDPVIVKLLYVDAQQIETCVTDMQGRYGFLVRPGKFKVFAKKTNYIFPSQRVAGDQDGIYDRLYHGEFFEMYGNEGEVLAPNIPMDPLKGDWNQQAKMSISPAYPYLKYLLLTLTQIFFWFGFIFTSLYLWGQFGDRFTGLVVLSLYLLIFLFRAITPPVRLWGRLVGDEQMEDLMIELHDPKFPSMVFGKSQIHPDGKFFLRANPGSYEVVLKQGNSKGAFEIVGRCAVRVSAEGVLNQTILLK